MKILIHGLNYSPEPIGIAIYTTGLAEALVAMGHEVRVITAQPYYPAWKIMGGFSLFAFNRSVEKNVKVLRVPHYIPSCPSGAKRLLHHVSFALSSLLPALWSGLTWRPDVVLAIAPSLIAAPVARLAARISGAPAWLHVHDFEVEAAFATGLLPDHGLTGRLSRWFEQRVLSSFHTVSSISPQMCRKLLSKGLPAQRVSEFRNWAEVDAVGPLGGPSAYRREWGIETRHVALYSGNIANKQGIEIIVEAARLLRHRTDLTFVICGEGPNLENLKALADGLPNVQFHDLQPRNRLNDLLGLASVHLLPQSAGAADLVLPSKLGNMLASGRPVVATAAAGTGLAHEVEGCGLVTEPGDADAFAAAIVHVLDDGEGLYPALCNEARRRAVSRWGARGILTAFEARLTERSEPCEERLARQ